MSCNRNRVRALIPVYNDARHLADVLRRVKEQGIQILVVDDGSTDNTSDVARNEGVEVLQLKENQGKGFALRAGFNKLIREDIDWVLILDADGQHLDEAVRGLGDDPAVRE